MLSEHLQFSRRVLCGAVVVQLLIAGIVDARLPDRSTPLLIRSVTLSSPSFNPTAGEKLQLQYTLSRDAVVTVSVFDPDRMLVRAIVQKTKRKAGTNRETWNGKDIDGRVVPDEAYFFVIEAKDESGNAAVHDPITFSGGESGDVGAGRVDRGSGTIEYRLSQPSRVLLRAGIAGSAMFKTIVDWKPRAAGAVTEYWNGKDEDGLIDVLGRDHRLVLTYTTLPDTSVITYGNSTYDYRAYRASWKTARPAKEPRPMTNHRRISPHFLQSRLTDRAFRVNVETPGAAGSVADRVLVRLSVDPRDREVLEGKQYEIVLFVDGEFHTEEERGYLPFNAPIELKHLPPGEHIITANIITFGDQIGVGSRRIEIRR